MKTTPVRLPPPALQFAIVLLLGGALLVGGCHDSGKSGPTTSPVAPSPVVSTSNQVGTEEGARALLAEFVKPGANTAALTRSLQPTEADYLAVFDEAYVSGAREHYENVWNAVGAGIAPRNGQTEVVLTSATTSDFQKGTARAREFPSGWRQAAPRLKEGVTWYRVKFVSRHNFMGTAFDGLAFVNGHWAYFPRPWRALKDK